MNKNSTNAKRLGHAMLRVSLLIFFAQSLMAEAPLSKARYNFVDESNDHKFRSMVATHDGGRVTSMNDHQDRVQVRNGSSVIRNAADYTVNALAFDDIGTWRDVNSTGESHFTTSSASIALGTDGVPYVAFRDEANGGTKAKVMKLEGTSWVTVGNAGFSAGEVISIKLVLDANNIPFVAYTDGANGNKATVMRFNGTNWVTVGVTGFSAGVAMSPSLAVDANGTPYVAYTDRTNDDKTTVKKYIGGSWVNVGTAGFSAEGAWHHKLALNASGTPYVVYLDGWGRANVMKYTGSGWANVGESGFAAGEFGEFSLALDISGNPYIAYEDRENGNKGRVKRFNGTNWIDVGPASFSDGFAQYTSLALDASGTPYVAYSDGGTGGKVTVRRYNGSDWIDVGAPGFSNGWTQFHDLALDSKGTPFVAFRDYGNAGSVRVMKFGPATPATITTQPIAKAITGGESTSFTVAATGTGLTYQWQVSRDGGSTYTNISNGLGYGSSTTPTLTITKAPVSMSGYLYRVLIINGIVTYSNAVALTVNPPAFDNTRIWQAVGTAGFSSGVAASTSLAMDAHNTPYVAFTVDILGDSKATVMKFNGTQWVGVGLQGFSQGHAGHTSLVLDASGIPYVVYQDAVNGYKATVKKFDGTNWETVGKVGFSQGSAASTALALDANGQPYVAYLDWSNGNKATVMKYNGTRWVTVGNGGISPGYAYSPENLSLAFDGTGIPYVAYLDSIDGGKITVAKFNGTDWETLGTPRFSAGEASCNSLVLDANGTPYVAYVDFANGHKVTVKKFNGTNWVTVGTQGFSRGYADYTSLALDDSGTPFVTYHDRAFGGKVVVMRFNGTRWVYVGASGFSQSPASNPSLAFDTKGTPYVAYTELSLDNKAVVMAFAHPNVTPSAIALSPSPLTGNVSITENVAPHSVVGTFTTTDPDAADAHIYTLVQGEGDADNLNFTIDGNELKVGVVLDYETKSSYSVRIKTDDGNINGVLEEAFTIKVANVNETPTGLMLSQASLEENNEVGVTVAMLSSIDQDAEDTHTYALVGGAGGTDNASFIVEGNELKAARMFDYETKSSFSIRIRSTDSGGLTYESTKAIKIVDVQESVTGIAEEENVMLRVYPNPFSRYLVVSFDEIMESVRLVNSNGSTVLTKQGFFKQVELNTEALSPGFYIAVVLSKRKVYTRRVVLVN
jgi:hypothetical protein